MLKREWVLLHCANRVPFFGIFFEWQRTTFRNLGGNELEGEEHCGIQRIECDFNTLGTPWPICSPCLSTELWCLYKKLGPCSRGNPGYLSSCRGSRVNADKVMAFEVGPEVATEYGVNGKQAALLLDPKGLVCWSKVAKEKEELCHDELLCELEKLQIS